MAIARSASGRSCGRALISTNCGTRRGNGGGGSGGRMAGVAVAAAVIAAGAVDGSGRVPSPPNTPLATASTRTMPAERVVVPIAGVIRLFRPRTYRLPAGWVCLDLSRYARPEHLLTLGTSGDGAFSLTETLSIRGARCGDWRRSPN